MAHGDVAWEGAPTPPQKFFSFLGLKIRILVRSPAHLECFSSVIRPGTVQTCITPAHSDIPGWLWLVQRCWSSCRRGYWTLSSLIVNTWQI